MEAVGRGGAGGSSRASKAPAWHVPTAQLQMHDADLVHQPSPPGIALESPQAQVQTGPTCSGTWLNATCESIQRSSGVVQPGGARCAHVVRAPGGDIGSLRRNARCAGNRRRCRAATAAAGCTCVSGVPGSTQVPSTMVPMHPPTLGRAHHTTKACSCLPLAPRACRVPQALDTLRGPGGVWGGAMLIDGREAEHCTRLSSRHLRSTKGAGTNAMASGAPSEAAGRAMIWVAKFGTRKG